jgi:hypothetical protein
MTEDTFRALKTECRLETQKSMTPALKLLESLSENVVSLQQQLQQNENLMQKQSLILKNLGGKISAVAEEQAHARHEREVFAARKDEIESLKSKICICERKNAATGKNPARDNDLTDRIGKITTMLATLEKRMRSLEENVQKEKTVVDSMHKLNIPQQQQERVDRIALQHKTTIESISALQNELKHTKVAGAKTAQELAALRALAGNTEISVSLVRKDISALKKCVDAAAKPPADRQTIDKPDKPITPARSAVSAKSGVHAQSAMPARPVEPAKQPAPSLPSAVSDKPVKKRSWLEFLLGEDVSSQPSTVPQGTADSQQAQHTQPAAATSATQEQQQSAAQKTRSRQARKRGAAKRVRTAQ